MLDTGRGSSADLQSCLCSVLRSSALSCEVWKLQFPCILSSVSSSLGPLGSACVPAPVLQPGNSPRIAGGGDLRVHLVYFLCLRNYFPLLPDVHGVRNCFTYFFPFLGVVLAGKVSSLPVIPLDQVHKSLPIDHLIRVSRK